MSRSESWTPTPPTALRHPRLMLTDEDVQEAKEKIARHAWAAEAFEKHLQRVDQNREVDPEGLEFAELNLLAEDAALAYVTQGEDWQFEMSRKLLMAEAMRFSYELGSHRFPPGPFGHGTWVLSPLMTYDILAGELSVTERNIICERLFSRAAEFFGRMNYYDNNFQIFLNIGRAAIGMMFDMHDLIEAALNAPFGLLDQLGRCILDDGNYVEGTCRYSYAVSRALAQFLRVALNYGIDLRHASLPSTRGLELEPGEKTVKLLFDAPVYRMMPGGREAAVNDTSYWSMVGLAEIWDLAWSLYRDPQYAGVLRLIERMAPGRFDYRHAFFYRAVDLPEVEIERGTRRFAPLGRCIDGSSVFRDMGYAMLEGQDEISLFFKCGLFGGAHGHADSLSVVVSTPERMLAFDHGTIGGYEQMQRSYAQQTIAHNTITVDQRSQGYWFTEEVKEFSRPVWPYHVDAGEKPVRGELVDFVVKGALRLARGRNANGYPGVELDRTLILVDDYVLDLFWAISDDLHVYDWAFYVDGDHSECNQRMQEQTVPLGRDWGYQYLDELQTCEGLDALAGPGSEDTQVAIVNAEGTGLCITAGMPLLWPVRTDTGIWQAMGEQTSITRFILSHKFPHEAPINPASGRPTLLIQRRHARTTCFISAIEYMDTSTAWVESVKVAPVFIGREPVPFRETEAVVVQGGKRTDVIVRSARTGVKAIDAAKVETDAALCLLSRDQQGLRHLVLVDGGRLKTQDQEAVKSSEPLEACTIERVQDALELVIESRWVTQVQFSFDALQAGRPKAAEVLDPSHAAHCTVRKQDVLCRVSPGTTRLRVTRAAE